MIYKAAVSPKVDSAAFANLSGKLTKIIGERINQRKSEEKLHELGILALYTRVSNMHIVLSQQPKN